MGGLLEKLTWIKAALCIAQDKADGHETDRCENRTGGHDEGTQ